MDNQLSKELQHWENEFWQIYRYHAMYLKCNIDLYPQSDGLCYRLKVTYTNKIVGEEFQSTITVHSSYGRNLYKRYRDAVTSMKIFFGVNAYVYEK